MKRALGACLLWGSVVAAEPAVIPITLPSGRVLQSEVMSRPEDQAMGLMFRSSLPGDRALLFVFQEPDFHAFWMKNCRFPIDMVWLDEAHKVVHLAEAVPPCRKDPCPSYQPLGRSLYVVEMNARQARRERVTIGSRIEFSLP